MKRTYYDTVNGIILSEFDIFEADHCYEDWNIIEDEEPIESTEERKEQERFEKFKQENC
jgi:hypothetical protein